MILNCLLLCTGRVAAGASVFAIETLINTVLTEVLEKRGWAAQSYVATGGHVAALDRAKADGALELFVDRFQLEVRVKTKRMGTTLKVWIFYRNREGQIGIFFQIDHPRLCGLLGLFCRWVFFPWTRGEKTSNSRAEKNARSEVRLGVQRTIPETPSAHHLHRLRFSIKNPCLLVLHNSD